jgi:hypothetical protein
MEHAPSPHDHTPGDGEQRVKPRDDRPRAARVPEAARQISASRSATAVMDAASGPSYGTAQRPSARQHSCQYRRGPQRCRACACTREFRSRANATGHRCGFESGAQRMTVPPRSSDRTSRAIAKRGGLPQLKTLAEAEARNLARIDALFDRGPEIAARLEACERGARCGVIVCAVCARRLAAKLQCKTSIGKRFARRIGRNDSFALGALIPNRNACAHSLIATQTEE